MRECYVKSARQYGLLKAAEFDRYLVLIDGELVPRWFKKSEVELF